MRLMDLTNTNTFDSDAPVMALVGTLPPTAARFAFEPNAKDLLDTFEQGFEAGCEAARNKKTAAR